MRGGRGGAVSPATLPSFPRGGAAAVTATSQRRVLPRPTRPILLLLVYGEDRGNSQKHLRRNRAPLRRPRRRRQCMGAVGSRSASKKAEPFTAAAAAAAAGVAGAASTGLSVESTARQIRASSCTSSSTGDTVAPRWSWTGPPGDHSPYPVDSIPYPPDTDLLYCFVDIMASYQIMKNQINLGPSAVTTNVEQFLHEITDCYREGFTLNKFVRIPGVKMTTEVTDWSLRQPYQAILSKQNKTSVESVTSKEDWQLVVEKRILSTRTLAFDETDQENDLLNTIHRYASGGAQLICAEPVGYVRSDSPNEQYGIMGVELFFNVPLHSRPTRFTYHTVTIPAMYHIIPDDTQSIQQVICDADFFGQMKVFLDTGWKLVDICMDTSAIADAYKLRATSKRVETIWIFEKETSKLMDNQPKYEGVIIEYLHKVKVGRGNEKPCRDWRPVIAGMGVTGWELATIIQTPLLVQSSFTTYTMKLLFMFQRILKPIFGVNQKGLTVLNVDGGNRKTLGANRTGGVGGGASRGGVGGAGSLQNSRTLDGLGHHREQSSQRNSSNSTQSRSIGTISSRTNISDPAIDSQLARNGHTIAPGKSLSNNSRNGRLKSGAYITMNLNERSEGEVLKSYRECEANVIREGFRTKMASFDAVRFHNVNNSEIDKQVVVAYEVSDDNDSDVEIADDFAKDEVGRFGGNVFGQCNDDVMRIRSSVVGEAVWLDETPSKRPRRGSSKRCIGNRERENRYLDERRSVLQQEETHQQHQNQQQEQLLQGEQPQQLQQRQQLSSVEQQRFKFNQNFEQQAHYKLHNEHLMNQKQIARYAEKENRKVDNIRNKNGRNPKFYGECAFPKSANIAKSGEKRFAKNRGSQKRNTRVRHFSLKCDNEDDDEEEDEKEDEEEEGLVYSSNGFHGDISTLSSSSDNDCHSISDVGIKLNVFSPVHIPNT